MNPFRKSNGKIYQKEYLSTIKKRHFNQDFLCRPGQNTLHLFALIQAMFGSSLMRIILEAILRRMF